MPAEDMFFYILTSPALSTFPLLFLMPFGRFALRALHGSPHLTPHARILQPALPDPPFSAI